MTTHYLQIFQFIIQFIAVIYILETYTLQDTGIIERKGTKMREIALSDDSGNQAGLTLWNGMAEIEVPPTESVIKLAHIKIGKDYNGRTFSSTPSTTVEVIRII